MILKNTVFNVYQIDFYERFNDRKIYKYLTNDGSSYVLTSFSFSRKRIKIGLDKKNKA